MSKPDFVQPIWKRKHAAMCVYADNGVGKSRFIGESPGNLLIIRSPTDHLDSLKPEDKARAEEAVVTDWDEMNTLLEFLRHEGDQYDWVWADCMSNIQDWGLDDIWETTVKEKPHRGRYGLDKQEYGINMTRLGVWMRHLVGCDKFNFGFTAWPTELAPSQDDEQDEKLMPWIQGKNMASKFCGYMQVVAFMEVAKIGGVPNRRVLRLDASERYYAKDQYDMTKSGKMVDPSMVVIDKLIKEKRAEAKAAAERKTKKPAASRRKPIKRK